MSQQFRIITGSYEHNVLCVSLNLPKEEEKSAVFTPIFHLETHSLSIYTMSASKRYLVTGSKDEHIKIYDLQKRKELGDLLGHDGSVNALQFSGNGKWLISGGGDGKLIVWRVKDWEIFGTLKGHTGEVTDFAIHPSSKIAVSCSTDMTLRLWNLMTVRKAAMLRLKYENTKAQKPQFVRWNKEGDKFFVCLLTRVLVYETATSSIVETYESKSSINHMELYEFHGKEYLVLGKNDCSIEWYNLDNLKGEPSMRLMGHTSRIKDFAKYETEAQQSFLVSVSSDGKIVVWDLEKKEQVAVYDATERLNCVAVVPESVEKSETMRKRVLEAEDGYKTESEYETDGEGTKKVLFGKGNKKSKKNKKNKKAKVVIE